MNWEQMGGPLSNPSFTNPIPEQKSLGCLQDSSEFASWSGSPVMLFRSHFARHCFRPPTLLHIPCGAGVNLNQPSLNICANTDTHLPLGCLQKNGRKPNLYAVKPFHWLCMPQNTTINRGARTAYLALPEQHYPFVSLACDLSYYTNFPSELSTVDIKYRSTQEKKKTSEKRINPLHLHLEKQMDVWVSHMPQVVRDFLGPLEKNLP